MEFELQSPSLHGERFALEPGSWYRYIKKIKECLLNFEVQLGILGELKVTESDVTSFYNSISSYYLNRAEIIKRSKKNNNDDYKRYISLYKTHLYLVIMHLIWLDSLTCIY